MYKPVSRRFPLVHQSPVPMPKFEHRDMSHIIVYDGAHLPSKANCQAKRIGYYGPVTEVWDYINDDSFDHRYGIGYQLDKFTFVKIETDEDWCSPLGWNMFVIGEGYLVPCGTDPDHPEWGVSYPALHIDAKPEDVYLYDPWGHRLAITPSQENRNA